MKTTKLSQFRQSNARQPNTTLQLALVSVFLASSTLSIAQTTGSASKQNTPLEQAASNAYVPVILADSNNGFVGKPVAVLDGMYAGNANIGRIHVKIRNAGVPADGVSELTVDVTVFDLRDEPMNTPVLLTIENKGGRLQLLGSASDEFGPSRKDADRLVPGTQLRVDNGTATFMLIAPSTPQDVALRVTGGNSQASGVIPFGLDLREMIASGLVEGSLRLSKQSSGSTISPVRVDDGFEQEITRFSRSNVGSNGKTTETGVRAAFFLKGKISGDALLTMGFDSDKETRARLLRDLKPEEFYPVYGDASIKGFEARSSDRLYVRIDKARSFVMYGDYNTADGFSQSAGSGVVAGNNMRQLATYNRTLTGVKSHAENATGFVNAFAAYDTLKNVTEEQRTNGTSGPFAVNNRSAVENSEKIEILVRDRNNLANILSVISLARLNDYLFEPFSGRILLNRPIPSQDSNSNPMSLRISYEVDQGGERFLLAGVDGQLNLGKNAVIGATIVQDKNPNAPLTLVGVNAGVKIGDKTTVIAEIAQSKTAVGLAPIAIPALAPVTPLTETSARAARVEVAFKGDDVQASAYLKRTEAGFSNTSAGSVGNGTQQAGAALTVVVSPKLSAIADIKLTDDLASDARTLGASVGVTAALSEAVKVRVGVRHSSETGVIASNAVGIGCNPAAGSAFAPSSGGGFTGSGSSSLLNVNGGINCVPAASGAASSTNELTNNTLIVGIDAKINDKLTATASAEGGRSNGASNLVSNAGRFELGLGYQVAERTRLYARADTQRGLASQYGIDSSSKSSSVSLGIDSTYMHGGNVFSEYRLRDAIGGQESQWASGVRNAWQISDGLMLSTGAERLRILSGSGQNATAATVGLDYTQSELWKAGGKLEWRRLNASAQTMVNSAIKSQDTVLFTVNAARKLDREWTLLARNYYLGTNNHGSVDNGWQDRFQIGTAYRPVDNNRFDALMKLEYKTENNINAQNEYRRVMVGAAQFNYHPSRPWWLSGRLAGKSVNEQFPANEGGGRDSYKAFLVGGRLIYDITEKLDLGLNLSVMSGKSGNQLGSSVQKGMGLEAGYAVASNLWASAGYNFTGYTDKDLTSDYTGKGAFLRLRYKFDQDLFQSNNPQINNTLERSPK
jgi:hypothetical protein